MRARKYRVASNDTVLSATRYGPYARLSRIISCRYTVVITDFSVSPYNMAFEDRLGLLVDAEWNARKNNHLQKLIRQADF